MNKYKSLNFENIFHDLGIINVKFWDSKLLSRVGEGMGTQALNLT